MGKPKAIIIGAAGFIGGNLCHKLNELGYDFSAIDNLQFGYKENVPPCDFGKTALEFLSEKYLSQFDVLVAVHCSNIIHSMNNPVETFINNAVNTIDLFSKFKGKIIYTSTSSIYGNADNYPTKEDAEVRLSNAYDSSKWVAEQFLMRRGNYTTLVLTNTYGRFQRPDHPYSGVLGKMIGCALNKKPFQLFGEGTATRDYTHVDDVVDAIVMAIDQPAKNTRMNISTGIETTAIQLAAHIASELKIVCVTESAPYRAIDKINRRSLDNTRAKELLGWEPKVTRAEGIKKTIEWQKQLL